MENVLTLDRLEIENKNEEDVNNLAVEMLREVCEGKGIDLIIKEMLTEYFIYHEDKKEIILGPSAEAKHVKLLIDFITY